MPDVDDLREADLARLRAVAPDPAWQHYLDAMAEAARLGHSGAPTPRVNRARVRVIGLESELVHDEALLHRLRAAVPTLTGKARGFVTDLVVPDVEVLWREGELLQDPRVGLSGAVTLVPTFYLVDHRQQPTAWQWHEEEGPYCLPEHAWPEDRLMRDWTRLGGAPTRLPDVPLPEDAVFLLQLDLASCHERVAFDSSLREVFASAGLPAAGVLQLFHRLTGDSSTEADLAGGGATVVYLPDREQVARTGVVDTGETDYRPHDVSVEHLPTFRLAGAGEGTSGDVADEVFARLQELVRLTDITARRGEHTTDFDRSWQRDPLTAWEAPSTHFLGEAAPEHPLDEEYVDLLNQQLPLTATGDEHRILFEVASDTVFDHVFGDSGRLQVWIRDSDLRSCRFDDVVSFVRSG